MALVPWRFRNLYSDQKYAPVRKLSFGPCVLEIHQLPDASISIDKNTGNLLWDGAYLLASLLFEGFGDIDFAGKTVIELGSGTGLVGLIPVLKGASRTILTDLPGTPLALTMDNLERNMAAIKAAGGIGSASALPLKWGTPDPLQSLGLARPPEIIIAPEILYLQHLHGHLLHTLLKLSSPDTIIAMCYKKRGLGEEGFYHLANANFTLDPIPTQSLPKEFRNSDHFVFTMKKIAFIKYDFSTSVTEKPCN